MKTRLRLLARLLGRTFCPGRDSPARLTFRRALIMALWTPLFVLLQLMHWAGFLLDDLFFRGYRRVQVREPVFIVGVPRSGTTLLYRILAQDSERFTCLKLWELLLAPSVIERKVYLGLAAVDRIMGGPLAGLAEKLQQRVFGTIEGFHALSWDAPEEDYFLLLPIAACFLLIVPFPFWAELGHLAYFDRQVPPAQQRFILSFYRACLQRHLYVNGPHKQLLSKNPSFSGMIEGLNAFFPDAKFICTLRTPLAALPSLLSTMAAGTQMFGSDPHHAGFQQNLTNMLHYFYHHLMDVLPQLPAERHIFVTMQTLKSNARRTVYEIYRRFGWRPSTSFDRRLRREARRARSFKSRHTYSLARFGLEQQSVCEKFSRVFEHFGLNRP